MRGVNVNRIKMEKELRERIEKRISLMGLKKEHVGKQIGLDKVRFSQTLSGVRKITPDEHRILFKYLGL